MKKPMRMMIIAIMAACITAEAAYRTETVIVPNAEAHHYTAQITIIDVSKDGKKDVLSAPKVIVKAGEEGTVTIGDEKKQNGIFCTVLVTEIAEQIEAKTTILVKEKGEEKLSSEQRVTIKK